MSVQGAGSSLGVSDALLLGVDGGKGTLTLRDGAKGEADPMDIGVLSPESTVLVTGAGSDLTVYTGIQVGVYGTGTLTVADRATLSLKKRKDSLAVSLGVEDFSRGTFVIDGGAEVDFEDRRLTVGESGTGVLTVSGGGSLNLLNCVVASRSSSSGSVLVTGARAGGGARSRMRIASRLYVGFSDSEERAASFDVNAGGIARVGDTVTIAPRSTLRFNSGSVAVGAGDDTASDCVLWPGGTLVLLPGGNLIGGPGMLRVEGGTITTRVGGFGSAPPPHPGGSRGLSGPAVASPVATISSAMTMNAASTLVLQFGPAAANSGIPGLRVTGPATLDGRLVLQFVDGFAPVKGQEFNLFGFQSTIAGQFARTEILGLEGGFLYDVKSDSSGSFTLTALNDGVAASPPQLSLSRSGTELIIAWPQAASGFGLERNRDPASPDWEPVPNASNPFRIPLTQAAEFFRLRKP